MLRLAIIVIITIWAFACIAFTGVHPAEKKALVTSQDTLKENYLLLRALVNKMKIGESEEASPIDSASIIVYVADSKFIVGKYQTNRKGKCEFKVRLHSKYDITISKDGFVKKSITVNTDFNKSAVPEKKLKTAYDFPFAVDIFEDVKGLDVKVLEKPIAKVAFNYTTFNFEYDANYTGRINSELRKMYKDYYLLLKMAADTTKDSLHVKADCKTPATHTKNHPKRK
jgi:hypothetical protein